MLPDVGIVAEDVESIEETRNGARGAIAAIREHGTLFALAFTVFLGVVGIYAGSQGVATGEYVNAAFGTVLLVLAMFMADIVVCSVTSTETHECRDCRKENDRWRAEDHTSVARKVVPNPSPPASARRIVTDGSGEHTEVGE